MQRVSLLYDVREFEGLLFWEGSAVMGFVSKEEEGPCDCLIMREHRG